MHAPACINDPFEPRLFILSGDGNGTELLRASDVEEYERILGIDATGTIEKLGPSTVHDDEDTVVGEKRGAVNFSYITDLSERCRRVVSGNGLDMPGVPPIPHAIRKASEAGLTKPTNILVRILS